MATARIHAVFTTTVRDLAEQARLQALSSRGTGRRPWNVPSAATTPGPLDIPGTTAAFDRTAVNKNYAELVGDGTSPGTVGEVVSIKTQGDYVAIAERGYRARHCTPVRLMAMSLARRQGHGHPRGVFRGVVGQYVQDALKAGQS